MTNHELLNRINDLLVDIQLRDFLPHGVIRGLKEAQRETETLIRNADDRDRADQQRKDSAFSDKFGNDLIGF